MPKNEKVEIIRSNFTKLLKAVDFLHTKKDMVIINKFIYQKSNYKFNFRLSGTLKIRMY